MTGKPRFDEVMIVNPSEHEPNTRRVRLMRFDNVFPPEMGYVAEPGYGYYGEPYLAEDPHVSEYMPYGEINPALGYYGEVDPRYGDYGERDPAFGYFAQAPYYGGIGAWGDPNPYGAAEPVGYFAEESPFGYYGEGFPLAGYGEPFPLGYYGEDPHQPMGYYGNMPEMVGYGEPQMQFAEYYPGVGYYGEPQFAERELADYAGYVRATAPAFNPGCPVPTNVAGFDEVNGFDGYVRPSTVNPSCDQITPQPGAAPSVPETFKPLW